MGCILPVTTLAKYSIMMSVRALPAGGKVSRTALDMAAFRSSGTGTFWAAGESYTVRTEASLPSSINSR